VEKQCNALGLNSTSSHAGEFINNIPEQVQVPFSDVTPLHHRIFTLRSALAAPAIDLNPFVLLSLYRPRQVCQLW
jgi:hypothetical protein